MLVECGRSPLDRPNKHAAKFRLRSDRSAPTFALMAYPPTTAPFLLTGRKVLIVDDDRLNIRILGGILKGEGYTLGEADSGERALEVYQEFQPDLVLLDVMMPGIDGFETCRRLK